jgi:hypothetical protein
VRIRKTLSRQRRRKKPQVSERHKAREEAYKASWEAIPETVRCAACGVALRKVDGHRHHPAGRRKASYLFTVVVHGTCHEHIHHDPEWGTARALLWRGRNSKTFTEAEAEILVMKMPAPPLYALEIYKRYQP